MSLGIYEAEPAGNTSGAFLWAAATLRFQGKQRPFHQIGQAAGKLLSELCHCQSGLQWLSPLFFPSCTSHPTFSPGLGASLLQPLQHISPLWLFSHVLIHLPGIDLQLREVSCRSISATSKGTAIPSGLFWHVRPNRPSRNAPRCYALASDVSDAPTQPFRTLKTLFNVSKIGWTTGSGMRWRTEASHTGFRQAQTKPGIRTMSQTHRMF